jgi:signal transduction histidine kinase/ligand-binding sensor domain-containing protein
MPKFYYIFFAVFFTAGLKTVSGQLNPNNLKQYGEWQGSMVYDVMPDRMGNIWLATQNGLAEYNGYESKRFYHDPNDSTTIGSILTYRLFEDRNGNIWIGSLEDLSVYNPRSKSFKSYEYIGQTDFPVTYQTGISTITADTAGRVYFGVDSFYNKISTHTLLYYDEKEDKIKRFNYPDSLEVQNVYSATSDLKGNVWFISHNGFFQIDPFGNLHQITLPAGIITGNNSSHSWIRADKEGMIWLTSEGPVLYAYNPGIANYRSWPLNTIDFDKGQPFIINQINIDSTGNIWLGTSQGLVYFDREKEQFESFENNPAGKIEHAEIYCLNFDSFGNLWLGTPYTGLLKYEDRVVFDSFTSFGDEKTSLTPGWVYRMYESSEGKVWLATIGDASLAGITVFDPDLMTTTPLPVATMMHNFSGFTSFIEQRPGEFLATTGKEFYLYFTKTNTIKRTSLQGIPDSVLVFNFYRDSHGNLWFCTNNSLYLSTGDGAVIRHIDLGLLPGSNASSEEVVTLFEGKKHGLWIASNNGLFLYDYETGKVGRHGYDRASGDIFMSQDINSIYEDDNGLVWVGTWQGGLSKYNVETGKIKTYTSTDGLPSMSIQGILADEQSKTLWLSTFEGISKFSIEDGSFNNFSLEDGIQGLMYADGSCLKTSGGLYIFGGNNGITVFKSGDIEKNSQPPKVFITDFKIANKSIASGPDFILNDGSKQAKEVTLKYNQNNISIDYLGIHYANPSRNKFAYKLENYDDEWREVGNVRIAYYYNLPPGKYTFHVKAANNNGIWNEEGASLNIKITPPWFRTWLAYALYGAFLLFLIYSADRFQRKRVLLKERILAKEKELAQAKEIQKAYNELKTTQTQLLHSEKMASLGELAAGIAHEIQNPLNFVNNFSEVNSELINELQVEIEKGNLEDARAIAADIAENETKIILHGKRADAIVKGMLEHSRGSSGVKEPADLNSLADEFLRLAHHGLRAKEKSFDVIMKTDFDESIGKINIIQQDIGRVILNLIANALYTVTEKKKQQGDGYEPMVAVSTKKFKDKVELRVKDNGNGIPQNILDKIYQPFFTTKPTGQGTGLGLSLSFDIITKGHSGELKVETEEGVGTEFIVVLPV